MAKTCFTRLVAYFYVSNISHTIPLGDRKIKQSSLYFGTCTVVTGKILVLRKADKAETFFLTYFSTQTIWKIPTNLRFVF